MKNNMPYIRTWINLFNYKAKIKRKEFFIDLLIHLGITTILALLILLFKDVLILIIYCPFVFIFFVLPYLSLTARRINDTGATPYLCFISLVALYGLISNFIVCCFKSKEDCIEFKKKKYFYAYFFPAIACVAFIVLFIIHMIVTTLLGTFNELDNDINNYETKKEELEKANLFLPDLNEFSGSGKTLNYGYKRTEFVFVGETISLYVTFEDNEDFTNQLTIDNNRYVYHEEVVLDSDGDYIIPVTEFSYNGFNYKIVSRNKDISEEQYNDYLGYIEGLENVERYCKSFMLYGVNEETKTISYMYFYDYDLDYISYRGSSELTRKNDMIDYLKDYFYLIDQN